MTIDVVGVGIAIPRLLRSHAEQRLRTACRRVAPSVVGMGITLDGRPEHVGVACQADVWLRGVGLVRVRHADFNFVAAICAAGVRLEQAVIRRLRSAGRRLPPAGRIDASRRRHDVPRFGLILREPTWNSRLALFPLLRARCGFDRAREIELRPVEWEALLAGDLHSRRLQRLRQVLAMAQLHRPRAVVVAGNTSASTEQAARQLRGYSRPLEVIALRIQERWTAQETFVTSSILPGTGATTFHASRPPAAVREATGLEPLSACPDRGRYFTTAGP